MNQDEIHNELLWYLANMPLIMSRALIQYKDVVLPV